jgi:flagellar motor switch protein FliM
MSAEAEPLRSLFGESAKGGGPHRSLGVLDDRASEIAAAIRRGVPFLMRRGINLDPGLAVSTKAPALLADLQGPYFHVPLATDPGGSRAMLVLDTGALSFLLDAALGGDVDDAEPAVTRELTNAQRAAIGRLVDPMVKLLSDVFLGLGVRFRRLPAATGTPTEGDFAAITFLIGGRSDRKIVVAVSRDALASAGAPLLQGSRRSDAESRVPGILANVEVELVAELGRVQRRLASIDSLRVGNVIRLDTPVKAPVVVRIQGKPVFRGRPTTAGTQLAVSVIERFDQRGEKAFVPPPAEVEAVIDPLQEV